MGIEKNRPDSKNSAISKSKEKILKDSNAFISFSFKYVEFTAKFNFSNCELNYFTKLIERLVVVSRMKLENFKSKWRKSLHNHDIDWDDPKYTEDEFGIPDEEKRVNKPWQFGLDNNKFGRVHGFFINNIFYIRWFDPNHRLWELEDDDTSLDEEFINYASESINQSANEWAQNQLSNISNSYEAIINNLESYNDELTEELESELSKLEELDNILCEDCIEKLDNRNADYYLVD